VAIKRYGKPYIYVTWLAKLLGGNECLWSAWFKAHHKYEKYQEQPLDLVKWNRDHNRLMAGRKRELERDGWTVTTEEQNKFLLEGETALVAGKPDIVATKDGQILVVDGKTGRRRDSDLWQVLFYLFAVPKSRPDLKGELEGEVQYSQGDERITLTPSDLDEKRLGDIVELIKIVASPTAPRKTPSRAECERCDIGPKDCPQRVTETANAVKVVGAF
jgi:CRISPR/Cas system-associated exonuclease Cas4 (RecB family)